MCVWKNYVINAKIKKFARYLRQNMNTMKLYISCLQTARQLDSVRKDILCNILIQYDIHVNLVRLTYCVIVKPIAESFRHASVRHVSFQEWFETRGCSIAIAFQLWLNVRRLQRFQANQNGLKLNVKHGLFMLIFLIYWRKTCNL